MEWGASLPALEAARDSGKATPLDTRPELTQWTAPYWQAFARLSTSRAAGMGVGPIPWLAIAEYARMHALDPDETDDFEAVISAMDQAYLEFAGRKAQQKPVAQAPPRR